MGEERTKRAAKEAEAILIPTSIFTDRTLKVLETLVEYLKESKQLTYHEIGVLIGRDDRTIWTAYHRASKKRKPHLHAALPEAGAGDPTFFPTSILCDRSLKILESIVEHMKDTLGRTYHEIAVLLNRDDRTIWTVYHRGQKKRNKSQGGTQP